VVLVKTSLGRSALHGLGVFAVEFLCEGTQVWRFTPGFELDLDPVRLDGLSAAHREYLLHYGYIDARLNRYILCCDDARFINHSDSPNILPLYGMDGHSVDIAVRDILPGEEITTDYLVLEGRRPE
jgi:hypothetical protein